METIKEIVNGTVAKLNHVCNGKVFYRIQTPAHLYQLIIDSNDVEWLNTIIYPEFKSITLMRWIRDGISKDDGTFIILI